MVDSFEVKEKLTMQVEIIGAESLGVCGLCCVVRTKDHKVVIDPGVALEFRRHVILLHPVQVVTGSNPATPTTGTK